MKLTVVPFNHDNDDTQEEFEEYVDKTFPVGSRVVVETKDGRKFFYADVVKVEPELDDSDMPDDACHCGHPDCGAC